MIPHPICLIDQNSERVAGLDVTFRDDHFEGTIDLTTTPPMLRRLFEQFEEIVEGQMFGLLDNIEESIGTIPLRARFTDGSLADVADLQVYPSTQSVSVTFHSLPKVQSINGLEHVRHSQAT